MSDSEDDVPLEQRGLAALDIQLDEAYARRRGDQLPHLAGKKYTLLSMDFFGSIVELTFRSL